MSPSLIDELHVVLDAAQVTLMRVGRELTWRGIARPLRDSRSVDCTPAGGGAAPWRAALEALGTALAGVSRPVGPATVLLSNRFMRYVVVPWSDALTDADEDEAFARHCFSDLYGDLAEQWELRLSPGRIGAPRIASAADRELLDALRETFGRAQLALRSIQPQLMAACNAARRRLRGRSAWVVLPEADAVCIGLLAKGEWVRIRSVRVGPPWQRHLPLLLERETLMADVETPREVVLFAPGVDPAGLPSDAPWQIEVLPPAGPAGRAPLGGAAPLMAPGG